MSGNERDTLERILRNVALRAGQSESIVAYGVGSFKNAPYIRFETSNYVPLPGIEGATKMAVDFSVRFYGGGDLSSLDDFHDGLQVEVLDRFVNILSQGRDTFLKDESLFVRPYVVRVMSAGANPQLVERFGAYGIMADNMGLVADGHGLYF